MDLEELHAKLFELHNQGKEILGSDGTEYTGRELSDRVEEALVAALNWAEVRGDLTLGGVESSPEEVIASLPAIQAITKTEGLRAATVAAVTERLRSLGKIS